MKRWSALALVLLSCKRAPVDVVDAAIAAPSVSVVASASASAAPLVKLDPTGHVALLEEVAAVHAKKLPCKDLEAALAPLRVKLAAQDASDPRLGAAIEQDAELSARRRRALDAIMDGAMRCRGDAG